jgi:hypothetical protein
MIVCDFDFVGFVFTPEEANPVLIVDAYGKLAAAFSLKRMEVESRARAEIFQRLRSRQKCQPPSVYLMRFSGQHPARRL